MPMWPCLSAVSDNVICGLIDREGRRAIAYLTCSRQKSAQVNILSYTTPFLFNLRHQDAGSFLGEIMNESGLLWL